MKWFQPIECDNAVNNPLVCEYDNFEDYGFDSWSFSTGKKIDNWNDNIIFQAKKKSNDGKPDDVLQNASMIPIFSNRLINELNNNNIGGIQFLPINVIRPNNEKIDGFAIANFLNFISAFNYNKSNFKRFRDDFPNPNVRGKIMNVIKFVLYKDKLNGMDIIRLTEYQLRFFVSENFKDIFEKNKFTGYSFCEVELV